MNTRQIREGKVLKKWWEDEKKRCRAHRDSKTTDAMSSAMGGQVDRADNPRTQFFDGQQNDEGNDGGNTLSWSAEYGGEGANDEDVTTRSTGSFEEIPQPTLRYPNCGRTKMRT